MLNRKGFTLIELLVVVLIIGILAAIALPQYTKAVERSRAAQLQILVKNITDAQKRYYLANSVYATSFEELDLELASLRKPAKSVCNFGVPGKDAVREYGNFEIILNQVTAGTNISVAGLTTTGSYKCSGFAYALAHAQMPLDTLLCSESAASAAKGKYCKLQGYNTIAYKSQWDDRYYSK
ncbi:prepilin-type N-terminal cleavage/methylation domain-containing protein [Elusimicrobium simillimum]|uniref:type IV pilin protein n=1 Tax=Elusimicrobium simillimum TaxID=3143438 RepID=UPI003C6F62AA